MNQPKKMADKIATAGNVCAENQAITKRFIHISDLASTPAEQSTLPVRRALTRRWVQGGKFLKPFKLAASTSLSDLAQVEAFIAQCAGGVA